MTKPTDTAPTPPAAAPAPARPKNSGDKADPKAGAQPAPEGTPAEEGGPSGPEPTRFGDWERNGRCVDF